MADGKWVMTEEDSKRVDLTFSGSDDLQSGFGGFGDGFGYKSFKCRRCGGTTDLVYRDENGLMLAGCAQNDTDNTVNGEE